MAKQTPKPVMLKGTNAAGKKVGNDGKACQKGYTYGGSIPGGKDICRPTKK